MENKQQEAFELLRKTFEALLFEHSSGTGIRVAMVKQVPKRRKAGFSEFCYAFQFFSGVLEVTAEA